MIFKLFNPILLEMEVFVKNCFTSLLSICKVITGKILNKENVTQEKFLI